MNVRSIFVVLLAIICGVCAAVGMNQLRRPVDAVKTEPETTPVVVAARNIARGSMVTAKDVEVRPWPKEMLPEGIVTSIEGAVDRAAMVPILAREPILELKLAAKDSGRGLAALVAKGMRAYTIQSARAPANVAGFILPGNKVDVILNLRGGGDKDESGGGSSTTLLQAVEILAVDQNLDAPAENKVSLKDHSSVTLHVSPDQAALLDLGQNLGQLSLALRNAEDKDEARPRVATLADIRFRQEKPLELPKEAPKAEPVEVIPAAAEVVEEEPVRYEIVTLKGNQRGRVWINAAKP